MGSGKISSSPFSTPSKMARATDSGEALGMSRPRDISESTGPVRTACTLTPRPAKRARNDCGGTPGERPTRVSLSFSRLSAKIKLRRAGALRNAEVSNFLCFLFVSPTTVRDQPGGIVLSGPELKGHIHRAAVLGRRINRGCRSANASCSWADCVYVSDPHDKWGVVVGGATTRCSLQYSRDRFSALSILSRAALQDRRAGQRPQVLDRLSGRSLRVRMRQDLGRQVSAIVDLP